MMIRIISVVAVVLIGVAVVLAAHLRPPTGNQKSDESGTGGGWEYLVVQGGNVNLNPSGSSTMRKEREGFTREAFSLEQNMDKLGAKGWELVQVTGSPADPTFYFKRRK